MTKNKIIALLIVLLILSTAFGYYQKKETDKFEAQATENQKIAREACINAEKQLMLAQDRLQVALAELIKCNQQK